MTEIERATLASWLRPAVVELTEERLGELALAVDALAKDLAGHELDAVRASHGDLSEQTRAWATTTLAKAESPVYIDDGELVERLISCAVVGSLDEGLPGTRCALGILSAEFIGLTPMIAELPILASEALTLAGRNIRARPEPAADLASGGLGKLPPVRKPTQDADGNTTPVNPDVLAGDIGKYATAVTGMAREIDDAFRTLIARQAALDEEVEMLWWALRATDSTGNASSGIEPALRAAGAAVELADRTSLIPGPPSAPQLLATVLGDLGETDTNLGDLAAAVGVCLPRLSVTPDPFLVLCSAALDHRRGAADDDDDSWRAVATRTLGVDLAQKTSYLAGSKQIYRELLLARALPEPQ